MSSFRWQFLNWMHRNNNYSYRNFQFFLWTWHWEQLLLNWSCIVNVFQQCVGSELGFRGGQWHQNNLLWQHGWPSLHYNEIKVDSFYIWRRNSNCFTRHLCQSGCLPLPLDEPKLQMFFKYSLYIRHKNPHTYRRWQHSVQDTEARVYLSHLPPPCCRPQLIPLALTPSQRYNLVSCRPGPNIKYCQLACECFLFINFKSRFWFVDVWLHCIWWLCIKSQNWPEPFGAKDY